MRTSWIIFSVSFVSESKKFVEIVDTVLDCLMVREMVVGENTNNGENRNKIQALNKRDAHNIGLPKAWVVSGDCV
jgi:hypothetical protein